MNLKRLTTRKGTIPSAAHSLWLGWEWEATKFKYSLPLLIH